MCCCGHPWLYMQHIEILCHSLINVVPILALEELTLVMFKKYANRFVSRVQKIKYGLAKQNLMVIFSIGFVSHSSPEYQYSDQSIGWSQTYKNPAIRNSKEFPSLSIGKLINGRNACMHAKRAFQFCTISILKIPDSSKSILALEYREYT